MSLCSLLQQKTECIWTGSPNEPGLQENKNLKCLDWSYVWIIDGLVRCRQGRQTTNDWFWIYWHLDMTRPRGMSQCIVKDFCYWLFRPLTLFYHLNDYNQFSLQAPIFHSVLWIIWMNNLWNTNKANVANKFGSAYTVSEYNIY